jgi:hypothetical protein
MVCIALMLYTIPGRSCDVCGCQANNLSVGIQPQFYHHFVGIRYQQSRFTSTPHDSHSDPSTDPATDVFRRVQLWGRITLHPKVQLLAFIPYQMQSQIFGNQKTQLNGIGDLFFLTNYMVWNTTTEATKKWKHALQVGTGVKLPNAKSDALKDGLLIHPNLQLGTGSTDFPIQMNYTLRYKNFGAMMEGQYMFKGKNEQDFHFGNTLTQGARFFYWKDMGDWQFLPQLGYSFDWAQKDKQRHSVQTHTGGEIWHANLGTDIYYSHYSLQALVQQPFYQHLGEGNVHSGARFLVNFIYLIQSKKTN